MWWNKKSNPRIGDELRFHRERLIEDYLASGMERNEAERRAFIEFGNIGPIEEAVRDVRGRWLEDFSQDLLYACRTFRRNLGFSIVAVLSLALGIGANTAIFNLVNAVLLHALPVREPNQLVQLGRVTEDGRPRFVSYPIFELFRDNVSSLSGVFAYSGSSQSALIAGDAELVTIDSVSGEYFDVLGVTPSAGRLFTPADDAVSPSTLAAVITDGYWMRRFNRGLSAIGTSITVRNRVFTIVGVTRPGFASAEAGRVTDIILPLLPMLSDEQRRSLGFNSFAVLGRLRPGAHVRDADAQVQTVFKSFLQTNAPPGPEARRAEILRQGAAAVPAPSGFHPLRANVARPLLLLMGIVAMILLLACVNLSGLLLARAEARQREVSIRLAIGAGRGRLARQFLTESLVLALLGGALGLVIATWFSARLFAMFIGDRGIVLSLRPDWRVLVFTGAIALIACVVAGLAPALRAVRVHVNPGLKQVRARGHGHVGKVMVVTQLAISMVLLVGASLFIGTLVKLYTIERGFQSEGVLVLSVWSATPYEPPRALAIQLALLEELKRLPGARSVSAAQALPVGGGLWDRSVRVEGHIARSDEPNVAFNVIAPDYFSTLRTPIVSGREFTNRDTATAPRVAVVNESFAKYFFGNGPALGRHITSVGVTYEIVGVVGDMKYQGLREPMLRTMFIPWMQREGEAPSAYQYLVRTAGNPAAATLGLDRVVRNIDPGLRLRRATSYDELIDQSIAIERIMATFGALFGALALLIAALGMFGVLAYQVTRRTNELGMRLVLGAGRWSMMRLVLRDVAMMVVPGIAVGAGAALMLTGMSRAILFDLTPTDPAVFVFSAFVLASAAIVAGWLPARRAASVDPMVAIRCE